MKCVVAACVLGFALRIIGLQYGLPHVYNPDEVAIMTRALSFAKGTLNPGNFLYPTFFFYVLFAWVGIWLAFVWLSGRVESLAGLQQLYYGDPTGIYTAGRLLGAVAGTATVAAVYPLTRAVAGRNAAAAASLFVAVAPLHVRDSHYVKHDVPAALLVVLAYVAILRIWPATASPSGRTTNRSIAMASACCGVAFSTHYYCVFLAIPLLAAVIASSRREGMMVALKRCAQATAISALVFLALSPFIALEPQNAWRDIAANREIVIDRAVAAGAFSPALRYADMLLRDTVGVPIVLLSVVGLVVMLRRQPGITALLLCFPLAFFVFIANTFPASRYLNPLVPFIALFAGRGAAAVAGVLPARAVAFWLVTGAAAAPAPYQSVRADLFMREADTRTLALQLIESQVPAGATIAIQPYSAPLEPTRESLLAALRRNRGDSDPSPKFRLQLGQDPWPNPSYNLIYLGQGLDAEKTYVDYTELGGTAGLAALRRHGVAYVVLKRYNRSDPETLPLLAALAREGRKLATVSPYRPDTPEGEAAAIEPFLHNTDARIDAALARPGPTLEIWQLDGPGP